MRTAAHFFLILFLFGLYNRDFILTLRKLGQPRLDVDCGNHVSWLLDTFANSELHHSTSHPVIGPQRKHSEIHNLIPSVGPVMLIT